MTTDPNDADFAYAEWDRQVSPPGETPNAWTQKEIVVDDFFRGIVVDPDDGQPVRTGDINPEVSVDPNTGALYVVWQDRRFGPRSSVAFSESLDGGLTWSPTIKVNQTRRTSRSETSRRSPR